MMIRPVMLTLSLAVLTTGWAFAEDTPWSRHTIDASSRGADGVRLADVNGDGRLDIATGWEEGGRIRVYLQPASGAHLRRPWPAVTVGNVKSPEDAVFADLDGDGSIDVVSCCEGRERTVFFHWAPSRSQDYLDIAAWRTSAVPCTQKKQAWMFALPMDIDNQFGIDLVVGSKGGGGSVGWLQAPKAARNVGDWTYHPIYRAGWIMSLEQLDVDEDGDADVVVSDRKGSSRGVLWLENPGPKGAAQHAPWTEHRIGADGMEVMFLTIADIDGDRRPDIVCATRNKQIIVFRRAADSKVRWESWGVDNPHAAPNGKAVRVADVNLDGKVDLIHTVNNGGKRQHRGAVWMSYGESIRDKRWDVHDISGDRGVKFDLIQMLDVDRDGDLDLITCEERDNLGVFWYENPTR